MLITGRMMRFHPRVMSHGLSSPELEYGDAGISSLFESKWSLPRGAPGLLARG